MIKSSIIACVAALSLSACNGVIPTNGIIQSGQGWVLERAYQQFDPGSVSIIILARNMSTETRTLEVDCELDDAQGHVIGDASGISLNIPAGRVAKVRADDFFLPGLVHSWNCNVHS